ncbi:MAG TPA: alpha-amylase family glycosyl hydrolase [Bacteroidales bacterium]|nr:alpha-amylase family glycosyl hydrolase [Bacteroidales bacterium]
MKRSDKSSQVPGYLGPMFNAYPDSLGGILSNMVKFLLKHGFDDIFRSFYILPSIFNSDLDRGFSIIDYNLNDQFASHNDLEILKEKGMTLKLDLVVNHLSTQSEQFKDILQKGEESEFKDFFIDWNKFWKGYGSIIDKGYVQPDPEYIKDMFFRKQGLPLITVQTHNGNELHYWNTFYRQITEIQGSGKKYLGQIDLNINSQLVWKYYDETLRKLAGYGAGIIRLDAFAYTSKEPGNKNFFNEPATWDLLERIEILADKYELMLLPEIHSRYYEKTHEKLSSKGYLIYDFFLPGLILDALEKHENTYLTMWTLELIEKKIRTINMLGCHDGIPLLDLSGLLPEDRIRDLINVIVNRGGYVKDIHGTEKIYYQVNSTYFSALGEDYRKLLLARAIQVFMPGDPLIWYLDLFAGKNDYDAVKKAGPGGHKEINRTNLTLKQAKKGLNESIVSGQLSLLKFRNSFPVFVPDARIEIINTTMELFKIQWQIDSYKAILEADLKDYSFIINAFDNNDTLVYSFES